MNIEEVEIGKCYSCQDDAVYKVIAKGKDWVCVLHYSYNHQTCLVEIHGNDFLSDIDLETDSWIYDIFDDLVLDEYWKDSLRLKEE